MSQWYPQAAVQLRILPEDFHLSSDPTTQKVYVLNVVARNISITRNDYKTTDTFNMEIDYKSFPFDPRSIRACGVIIYLQDMTSIYKSDGSHNTIIPGGKSQPAVGAVNFQGNNIVFAGFVDDDNINLDEMNQMVKLTGRDYTALLIDQKYQSNTPIDMGQPVDVVLTNLLANFAATQQITVVNQTVPHQDVLPILSSYDPNFGLSPLSGQRNTGSHESYWEIIQDLVNRAGLICYINIDKLILTTPKNQNPVNSDDIKFIYGKNIKTLTFKRKLGRFKSFGIEVRSRSGKEVITARIPDEATESWATAFGIARSPVLIPVLRPDGSLEPNSTRPAPYIVFPVPNIGTKDQLVQIGQTTYEQYSLQQFEGTLETHEMLGRGQTYDSRGNPKKANKSYDLTQLQKGQTICLEIDTEDLGAISRLATINQRVQYLIHHGYSNDVAAIFSKTVGKFSPRFFVKSYTMDISENSGFSLKLDFVNILDLTNVGLT